MDGISQVKQYNLIPFGEVAKARNNGHLMLPVSQQQALYARFKYVTGVPSVNGGYSLTRLRSLDHMIGVLVQLGNRDSDMCLSVAGMDGDGIDKLIAQYTKELHGSFSEGTVIPGYAPSVETGMVLDMAV